MSAEFNDYDYTRDAIIKQLGLIELHGKDGSAVDAGCQCINTKHTYMLEGLSEEMVGFAKSEAEKKFYMQLAANMRKVRQDIDSESWGGIPPHLTACERKVLKCVSSGKTETECRRTVNCNG